MTDQSANGLDPLSGDALETTAQAALAQELADELDEDVLTRQFVTFHLQNEVFAVNMASVREIIRVPHVTRVPLAPDVLDGVANLRGSVVPIVSLRRLLGLEERDADEASRAVVVDVGQPVGFVVDRVSSVLGVEANQIEDAAESSGAIEAEYLAGMIKNAGGHAITMIVEFARLIAKEFALIAKSAQNGASLIRATAPHGSADDRAADEIHLVNFLLDGQDYGIAISDVQEIVHLPETITSLPQTPPHVLGVMTLRSRLLPLMDLRSMFRLAPRALDEKSRIVVLRLADDSGGELSVGLVVDTVSEVLRVGMSDMRDLPSLLATRGEESDITRVCQLSGGKRLVSIVNGHNLFNHPAVRGALDATDVAQGDGQAFEDGDMQDEEIGDDTRQLVVFRLGEEEFGVGIAAVKEILRVPENIFWVPKSAAHVEGVINLRGNVLPVIDLRSRMGLDRSAPHERQRIMVFAHMGVSTGFVVDHVAQVLVVPASAIEAAPSLSEGQSRLLPQVANLTAERRMLQLLDPASLLDDTARAV